MNIHEAARVIIDAPELPKIHDIDYSYRHGLCAALREAGAENAYVEMANHMLDCHLESGYLAEPGVWTEQRLNILCLLACTEPEDFTSPKDFVYEH